MHYQSHTTHTQHQDSLSPPTSIATSLTHTIYVCVICATIRRPTHDIARSRSKLRLAPYFDVADDIADDTPDAFWVKKCSMNHPYSLFRALSCRRLDYSGKLLGLL